MRSMALDYVKKIEDLAKPFVASGLYRSPEEFLKDIATSLAREKIKTYERTVKRFESKYNMSFKEFTEKSKDKARPRLEDDWMEWEASINLLKAWKKANREIGPSAT